MSDLIDRKAILKKIDNIRHSVQMMDDTHRASIVMTGMHLCEEAVRNQTSAEPERKTGRWKMEPDPYGFFDEIPVCSECGCTTMMRAAYKFCPNCGAKMELEERK